MLSDRKPPTVERSARRRRTPISQVDQMVCLLAAADGWGGRTPGAERCGTMADEEEEPEPGPLHTDVHEIVDYHFTPQADFWVCYDDVCHPGDLDEARYLLGGAREVEG